MAVSLRVSDDLKKRLARVANSRDTTAHALMLEAIREKLDAEEVRAAFHAEARLRLARMKKAGVGIPAGKVFDYFEARAKGRVVARPKARKTR